MEDACCNSSWNNTNATAATFSADGHFIFASLSIALAIIILLTNGVVIIAYSRDRKLRTISNFFIMNLVTADFLVGIALPVHAIMFLVPKSSLNEYICVAQYSLLGKSTSIMMLNTANSTFSIVGGIWACLWLQLHSYHVTVSYY